MYILHDALAVELERSRANNINIFLILINIIIS